MICSLVFETSGLSDQAKELAALLEDVPESVTPDLRSRLKDMLFDVVVADGSTTLSADGTLEVLQRLRFGDSFKVLRAALLARKCNHNHVAP